MKNFKTFYEAQTTNFLKEVTQPATKEMLLTEAYRNI